MAGQFGDPDIVEEQVDILLIGGGMGACGAAYEIGPWLEQAKKQGVDLRVKLVDKAAMDRSGAVARGLSAVNAYLGDQDPADYARMVSNELMGISRDDLTYDVGRHLDDSVHRFEEWGLPIRKQPGDEGKPLVEGGKPARSGSWGILVDGESCKPIVAEAARKALGPERIQEHVFVVRLLTDKNDRNRIAGAIGFSVREQRVYVYRAKAILLAAGGCGGIFRSRSAAEGLGRTWYPMWNAGSTYAMAAEAGAELTMMEGRYVPLCLKDGYGAAGAWVLSFKAQVTNALGDVCGGTNRHPSGDYLPYGQARVAASCLGNHLLMEELREGRGPIYLDTVTALGRLAETMTPKEIRHLEADAWADSLGAGVGQSGVWASENIEPEKKNTELMAAEPCLLGSHGGCCGLWVSGPTDLGAPTSEDHPEADRIPSHLPSGWSWGYRGMTTVKGLFAAADGVGASGRKFASGSHAEGRIAAKGMVKFCIDNTHHEPELDRPVAQLVEEIYRWVVRNPEMRESVPGGDGDSDRITPKALQLRLQKIMDEYVAGWSALYRTNAQMLAVAEEKLAMLKDDALKMCATDLHELLRVWENHHRILVAEAHIKHIQFREETRYPGFYYRTDYRDLDEENWKCFVNSVYDKETKTWTCFKRAHVDLVDKSKLFK